MNERLRDANLPADHFSAWEALAANGTFEEALDALESIVRLLDEGNLALDDSVRCFEIGTRLSNRCQDLLDAAELRISILTAAPEYDDEDQADPWLVKPQ